jgi:long-chain fatty acid transport protein
VSIHARALIRVGAVTRALSGAAAAAAVLASSGAARASGYHVDEQDARATGRGGAVVARSDNASAVYYNPAGVATSRGVQLQLGASVVRPTAQFTSAQDGVVTKADPESFVLPQLFASWRASELVAFGFGVYAPFGLALDWPASSPGSSSVRQAELGTVFITGIWALNLGRWVPGLSVAAGPDLVPAKVRLTRDIPFGSDTATAALSGDAFGLGGRIGVDFRPPALPWLALGLTLRSPVELLFDGEGDFDAPAAYRGGLPPDGEVSTRLTLPPMLMLGVAVQPIPELQLELDGNWRGWSSYDQLDLVLPDGQVQSSRADWKDSFTVRLGAEYTIAERWATRLGVIWDQTPIPANTLNFQLPDANRWDISAGFGAQINSLVRADFGALYVLPRKRLTALDEPEPPVKGLFRIDALVVVLSVAVQLETPQSDTPTQVAQWEPSGSAEGCTQLRTRAEAYRCQR